MEDPLSNFEILFKARGMSSIHGRIFGSLVFSNEDLTQEQLADITDYSIPAVSIALDELTRLRLAKKIRKRGDRKNYYTTDADLTKIFSKFLESIHDEHVVPFLRGLETVPEKNKTENMKKLETNLEDLRSYLEKLLEVKL